MNQAQNCDWSFTIQWSGSRECKVWRHEWGPGLRLVRVGMGKYLWNIFRGILWDIQCLDGESRHMCITIIYHIYYLIDEVFWDREPCFIPLQLCIAKYPITREAVIWRKGHSRHLVAVLNCLPARSDFFFIFQFLAQMHSSLNLW